jgi:hypothetical protein
MPEHTFTLIIDGDPDHDALYEAGCDDATFGEIDGVGFADFAREASSLADAVLSAIGDVESVEGLSVRRVEPEDLVTASEIAKRLGRTRESVRLLIAGRRGAGNFPAPSSHLRARSPLWRWSDVAAWAERLTPQQEHEARLLAAINAALELRKQGRVLPEDDRRAMSPLLAGAGYQVKAPARRRPAIARG